MLHFVYLILNTRQTAPLFNRVKGKRQSWCNKLHLRRRLGLILIGASIVSMNYVVQGKASVLSVLKYGFHIPTLINVKSSSHFCISVSDFYVNSLKRTLKISLGTPTMLLSIKR